MCELCNKYQQLCNYHFVKDSQLHAYKHLDMRTQLSAFQKTLLLLMAITVGALQINAQSNFKVGGEIQIPSTDSWNFIKFGEVGANIYSGTIGLSIPFYTYKDNDFEIPITFDYSSGGFMPNSKAGIMGPGWNLNAGGCITLEIKEIYSAS